MGLTNFLKSSLLSKFVMAVTGIILVAYIIGHTLGNLQFYLGPDVINAYASFLRGTGELLWVVRFVLFAAVILHIITSIRLSMLNQSSGGKYNVRQYVKTRIYSRTMLVTGITIAAFVVYHILHFTTGDIDPSNHGLVDHYGPNNLFERHDLYYNMVMSFRQPLISAIYIIGVLGVGFHLMHGSKSFFQTLGITGPKFTPAMDKISLAFGAIIALLLISIPVSVLLGLVGGEL